MSSSSLLSRSQEKSVYVRASNLDDELVFYSYALNDDDNAATLKTGSRGGGSLPKVLPPIKAAEVPVFGGCAAVGRTIYCVGGHLGLFEPSASLFCLDTRHPKGQSWKKHTSMRNPRTFYPTTVAFHGKIYVFGGLNTRVHDPKQWTEVFDTKSGQWAPLPPPPSQLPAACGLFAVPVPSLNKLLVGLRNDKFLYAYKVDEGHWERWDNWITAPVPVPVDLKPMAVGTALFWFHEGTLHAYDFTWKLYQSSPVKDLDKVVPPGILMSPCDYLGYPALLHVADNVLCLLCLEGGKQYYLLHCIEFSFSFVVEGGKPVNLHAAVVSSKDYVIEQTNDIIDAGLMYQPRCVAWNARVHC